RLVARESRRQKCTPAALRMRSIFVSPGGNQSMSGSSFVVRTSRALLLSTSVVALCSGQAFAQQAASDDIEEIVVTGISLSMQRAVEEKHDADTIQDSVSADDLGRLINKNSSEAVARLPGVNISQDQG